MNEIISKELLGEVLNLKTQIPLYRAKKIDSDEYVVGFLNAKTYNLATTHHADLPHYTIEDDIGIWRIDPSTLSIHFPNMIANDSDRLLPNGKKDLRIFASLSEDGKGGDIVNHRGRKYILKFCNKSFKLKLISHKGWSLKEDDIKRLKITGIQK